MKSTIPPLTGDEFIFFDNNEIVAAYENDKNYQSSPVEPLDNEPGLLFHEFVLLLGRICANCKNTQGTVAGNIRDFFEQDLFRKSLLDTGSPQKEGEGLDEESEEDIDLLEDEEDEDEEEMSEEQKKFHDFLERKAMEEQNFEMPEEDIEQELDILLPQIPGKPRVT